MFMMVCIVIELWFVWYVLWMFLVFRICVFVGKFGLGMCWISLLSSFLWEIFGLLRV